MERAWLKKKLETTDFVALASEEIRSFGLSEEDERDCLDRVKKIGPSKRWNEFIEVMQPGDEFWYYKSPDETWSSLCGRAGYAVVRKGEIVAYYKSVVS